MKNLIIFFTCLTLLSIFVFANNINYHTNNNNLNNNNPINFGPSFPINGLGVTDDPEDEFIPDCSRCERLRLVGCRRSEYYMTVSVNNNCFHGSNQQASVTIDVPGHVETLMEPHITRLSSLLFQAIGDLLQVNFSAKFFKNPIK